MTFIIKENSKLRLTCLESIALLLSKDPSPKKVLDKLDKKASIDVQYSICANYPPDDFLSFPGDRPKNDRFFLEDYGCKLTMTFSQGDKRYAAVKEFKRSNDIGFGRSCGIARQYIVDIIDALKKG